MKVCRTCGISKAETEFCLVYDNVGGRNGQCRSCKSTYDKNRKDIRAKQKRERLLNDPVYALKCKHMNALGYVIRQKGRYKNNSLAHVILGCESNVFVEHIEKLFVNDMTWDNHGEWEMDHIIPMSSAKTIDAVMTISNYKNLQPLWKPANMEKKHFVGDGRPPIRQPRPKVVKLPTVSAGAIDRPSLSNNNSTSKLAGVTWNKDRQKWRVRIKQICYGLYDDYEEAVASLFVG